MEENRMYKYQINGGARENLDSELKELFHDVGWVRPNRDWQRLNKAIRKSATVVSVRDCNDKLVGLCSTLDDGLNVVVTYLLVASECQGLHIGSDILNIIREHYCVHRIAVMTEKAEEFYSKNGFVKISTGLEFDSTNEQ